MLKFLANNIEQLDLALEHILKGDANNARFGLMLVDNVVEITLHQIAKNMQSEAQSWMYRGQRYEHAYELRDALGKPFGPKVKFARIIGMLGDESSETINIFHSFRNEVYHIGVQHEAILQAISKFYFKIAIKFLRGYSQPCWGTLGMVLPERARKYFKDQEFYFNGIEEYHAACDMLGNQLSVDAAELAGILADHIEEIIEYQDYAIIAIATDGLWEISRDKAVAKSMAWKIAFTDEGKAFAQKHGWSTGSLFDFVNWIEANYPIPIRKDPIEDWQKRAHAVRHEKNPHRALKKYRDFMTQTADTRAILDEAHGQVEQYIQEKINRRLGK